MSHYLIAVISDNPFDYGNEEVLAPFEEWNGDIDDCPPYITNIGFRDCTEEVQSFMKKNEKTFEEAVEEYGYFINGDRCGYWYNIDSKWDWYAIGGRWNGIFSDKEGNSFNSILIDDLDTSVDEEVYQNCIDDWNLRFSGGDLSKLNIIRFKFYTDEYLLKTYGDAETYAKSCTAFSLYGCITPDGEWHERCPMGMFGIPLEDENKDESPLEWSLKFEERFITPYKGKYITAIDCHI